MVLPLETIASYIPVSIIQRLAEGDRPVAEPQMERQTAAVFFADINGFTQLTESLAQEGPAGTEALSALLNDYFGQLIDHIITCGGDVIKFAGDALLAQWPAGDEATGLVEATLKAGQCGLTVQAILDGYQTEKGQTLSIRIGIGAGRIEGIYLGGVFDRWEYFIAGDPLGQVHRAQRAAPAGRVVLSPEAWELVKERCQGRPLPENNTLLLHVLSPPAQQPIARPELGKEMAGALYRYLPGAIRDRIAAGQSGWLAELRRITVLFINLTSFSHNTPIEQSQTVMKGLQEIIYRYEGSVNKLSVDDKGVTLVAALGLPPLAHEDDPLRAVQTAFAIHDHLNKLGAGHAVGVTTGRAFCGTIGNVTRREYTMIGDVVNLAARLMQAANETGHQLLCDQPTYAATAEQVRFNTLAPILVKGKTEAIPIYRPVALGQSQSRIQTSLVGRQREQATINDCLAGLEEGRSSLILIEGEAGIGKSRLVEEAIQQAGARRTTTFIGSADAIDKSTPYHVWRPIFAALFGVDLLNDSSDKQRELVMEMLRRKFSELLPLAPLLNAVLPLDLPESELTVQLSGEVRRHNTQQLLSRLLAASSQERPLFLILEDSQWLDSASWSLAKRVWQDISPMLLLVVTRPLSEPLPAEFSYLLSQECAYHLHLDAMPADEIEKLVCLRMGVVALPQPVARLIHQRGEGHPFFSEELAYSLRDAGLIEIVEGECRLTAEAGDLSSFDFPDTIQGVITSRVDRLTPQQTLTLKVASVIGRVFAYRILRDVHPIPADRSQLAAYLDNLEKLDITPLETPEPDLAYIFKHIITQEVVYNLMSFAQRQQLHQAVAEWYEQAYKPETTAGSRSRQEKGLPGEPGLPAAPAASQESGRDGLIPYFPLLAYHWSKAENNERSMIYFGQAGEQALRQFANQEAVDFLNKAITLDDSLNQSGRPPDSAASLAEANEAAARLRRARWERQLGEAHIGLGHLVEGRQYLERAAAQLGQPVPSSATGLVLKLMGQFRRQVGHRLRPGRLIKKAAPETCAAWLEAARIYDRLGEIYYFANEPYLTLYSTVLGLNLAERVDPSPELARLYANMSIAISLIPLHKQARYYRRLALETAEKVNDLYSLAWVNLVVTLYFTGNGHWQEGVNHLEQSHTISERLGAQRVHDQAVNSLSLQYTLQGKFEESLQLFRQTGRNTLRRGDYQLHALTLAGQAENLLFLGQLQEAVVLLEQATPMLGEAQRIEKIWVYGLWVMARLRLGEPLLAWEAAEKANELINQSQPTSYLNMEGYAGAALAPLSIWEKEQDRTMAQASRQAIKALQTFGRIFAIGRPRGWLYRGWFEWLQGRSGAARKAWDKGLTVARELEMPYEEGLAHYHIGRHLPVNDSQRAVHLQEAITIFERLGAAYDLAETRKVMKG